MNFNFEIFFDDSIQGYAEHCVKSLYLVNEISGEIILDTEETLTRKIEGFDSSEDQTGIFSVHSNSGILIK